MRMPLLAVLLAAALPQLAQTRTAAGVVQTPAGQPLAGLTVAITRMPIEEADDVTASATTDGDGRFHFDNLPPGQYALGAASDTVCGGAATVDLTSDSKRDATIITCAAGRTISGHVTGGSGAHVIAGHFHDRQADLYAAPVRDGRYAITLPASGTIVVQAIAPQRASVETQVPGTGNETRDLVLERRDVVMPAEARRWIAAHAIPLQTVEAGHGFDDMEPLRKVVGDARLVALGEATHGTRDFFQFKHRMLEFLVARMGFTLFGIEASEPDAIAVNDYVVDGKGDPAAALEGLGFWTWNTEEVLEMIRWMRRWNEDPAHPHKLRFYGFDMQNPAASKARLREWLQAKQPPALPLLDGTSTAPLAAAVEAIQPHDATWQLMRHLVDLIEQARVREPSARDRAMAENIHWILEHETPGAKMVVWAHNGHVATEMYPFAPKGTMGVHLRRMYGASMVVFGFVFDRGSFRAFDRKKGAVVAHHADPLDEKSFDHALATIGPPRFVLDLRKAGGATAEWLATALPHRSVGAVYSDATPKSYVARIHPLQSFDAVVFIAESTPSVAVRAPMAKPAPAAVNLSLDDGVTGWALSKASAEAGYVLRAETTGCFRGGCAVLTRSGKSEEGFGSLSQRIDAAPYRGKRVRFRARMRSQVEGASSARLWLRVDTPDGTGFFDNMQDRAPHALPEWTELEITGDVAPDAVAIAFGELFQGSGTAWIDEASLEVVP
jgi:erythromycin esterase